MHKFYVLIILMNVVCISLSAQEKDGVERNPFCFTRSVGEQRKDTKKAAVEIKEQTTLEHEEIALLSTETKWHVKTVLPSSVIMQHKEDGQIREIALTGTHVS